MKLAVIANPCAGRGRVRKFLRSFLPEAKASGRNIMIYTSKRAGHATELAREAAGSCDAVCVIGGDGTVHEVVNGLMPEPVPMVVIPSGSGDDFAKLVNCPRSAAEMFAVVDSGTGVKLDVIDCGVRYCANSVGLGFEAQVTRNSRSIKRLKGLPLYLLAVAKALAEFHNPVLSVFSDDGRHFGGPRLLVSVGNGVSAGGGFYLTPDASPDDGLIDVCLVEKMGRLRMLGLLPLSLKGTHTEKPPVTMLRTRALRVECDEPLHVHIDGEYMGDDFRSLGFTVLDRRLPVLCRPGPPAVYSQEIHRLL
jgi:YegS/Rv2252/BmrU family lipid kinase